MCLNTLPVSCFSPISTVSARSVGTGRRRLKQGTIPRQSSFPGYWLGVKATHTTAGSSASQRTKTTILTSQSSYGWLFTMDTDLNFRLLNPLTGQHYDLPPVPLISAGVFKFVREETYERNEMSYSDAQATLVYKAILDYDPAKRSDFTVLIIYWDHTTRPAFWRPGNLDWTVIEDGYILIDDVIYFQGQFYGVDLDVTQEEPYELSIPCLIDVGPNPKVTRIAPIVPQGQFIRPFLADLCGELLLVQRYRPKVRNGSLLTKSFLVYTLDLKEGKYYQRRHLDGYSLFLGHSSLSAVEHNQFPRCKENCIYFTAHMDLTKFGRHDNGIYDMVKGIISRYYPKKIFHPEIVGPIWWTPNPW